MIRLYDMLDLARVERRHRRECNMLGSFGFGAGGRCAGAGTYDPSTINFSTWLRASFSASPWAAVASAGVSGSHSYSEATNPPSAGAALNSLTPADFDGTNDRLARSGVTQDTFVSTTAYTIVVLYNADAAATDAGTSNQYDNPALVTGFSSGAIGGSFMVAYSSGGLGAAHYDGSSWLGITSGSAHNGAWTLGQARFDAGFLGVRLNGGAWADNAKGSVSGLSEATSPGIRIGANYNLSAFFNGRIAEVMISATALSDATLNNIRSYISARYAISV